MGVQRSPSMRGVQKRPPPWIDDGRFFSIRLVGIVLVVLVCTPRR